MKKVISVSILVIIALVSCSKNGSNGGSGGGGGTTVDCNTITNKMFAADVAPIISSSCAVASCHASAGNGPGALLTHAQIFAARSAIRSAVSTGRMPQGSTLSTSQKNSIICWIDSGATNN
jgi:hypothetical protein